MTAKLTPIWRSEHDRTVVGAQTRTRTCRSKRLCAELRALGRTGAPEAKKEILKFVKHPDKRVSKNAMVALGFWNDAAPFYNETHPKARGGKK